MCVCVCVCVCVCIRYISNNGDELLISRKLGPFGIDRVCPSTGPKPDSRRKATRTTLSQRERLIPSPRSPPPPPNLLASPDRSLVSRRDARGLNRKERPPRYDPETERKLSVKVVSYGDLGTNWSRRRRSVSRVTGTRGSCRLRSYPG